MSDNQMSNLAKAVVAGERITVKTDALQNGDCLADRGRIPEGATVITEGVLLSETGNRIVPEGGKRFTYSKDEDDGKSNCENNK